MIKTVTCIHVALVCLCGDYSNVFATLLGLVPSLIWDQNPTSHQYHVNLIQLKLCSAIRFPLIHETITERKAWVL